MPVSNNFSIRFNCGKQVMIHVNLNKIFLTFLIHRLPLMKAKSGKTFPKSPRLFPLKEKKFSYPLLISTRNTALKREQIETRLQGRNLHERPEIFNSFLWGLDPAYL
jgi:hypothetical protein